MEHLSYIYASFVALIVSTVGTCFIKNKSVAGFSASILSLSSSICLFYPAIDIVIGNKLVEQTIFSLKPLINSSFLLSIDSLSALFLLIISLISFCVSLFSWKYLNAYESHSPINLSFLMLLFISSIGVVCIKDILFFIVFWELMTLSSWFLIVFDREKKSALKGGLQYFIAAHVATAFLILASVILYSYSNDFSFTEIKKAFHYL